MVSHNLYDYRGICMVAVKLIKLQSLLSASQIAIRSDWHCVGMSSNMGIYGKSTILSDEILYNTV